MKEYCGERPVGLGVKALVTSTRRITERSSELHGQQLHVLPLGLHTVVKSQQHLQCTCRISGLTTERTTLPMIR